MLPKAVRAFVVVRAQRVPIKWRARQLKIAPAPMPATAPGVSAEATFDVVLGERLVVGEDVGVSG